MNEEAEKEINEGDETTEAYYENGDRKCLSGSKVEFLADNIFPVRFYSVNNFDDLAKQSTDHITFLTDETGLYTLIKKIHPEIHSYGFSLKNLVNRRYENLKRTLQENPENPLEDERYYATAIFKVDLIREPLVMYVEFLGFAGSDTVDI